jgi:hypothetical protein
MVSAVSCACSSCCSWLAIFCMMLPALRRSLLASAAAAAAWMKQGQEEKRSGQAVSALRLVFIQAQCDGLAGSSADRGRRQH